MILIEGYRISDDVCICDFLVSNKSYRDSFFLCHYLEDVFPDLYFFPFVLSECDENYI